LFYVFLVCVFLSVSPVGQHSNSIRYATYFQNHRVRTELSEAVIWRILNRANQRLEDGARRRPTRLVKLDRALPVSGAANSAQFVQYFFDMLAHVQHLEHLGMNDLSTVIRDTTTTKYLSSDSGMVTEKSICFSPDVSILPYGFHIGENQQKHHMALFVSAVGCIKQTDKLDDAVVLGHAAWCGELTLRKQPDRNEILCFLTDCQRVIFVLVTRTRVNSHYDRYDASRSASLLLWPAEEMAMVVNHITSSSCASATASSSRQAEVPWANHALCRLLYSSMYLPPVNFGNYKLCERIAHSVHPGMITRECPRR
jgi:hypothetical protein